MRYAILSDVHANESALRAVLQDAADAQADEIVCLGDVLGYGPDPVAALELIYRRAHVCLAGNHDDAVSGRFPVEDFTDFAAAAVERHRRALAPEALDWLAHLPHVCAFGGHDGDPAGAFACAHGDFAAPERFDYVLEPPDALPSWRARTEPLLFVGHTHQPGIFVLGPSGEPHALAPIDFALEPGKRFLVNVGSVGYPRIGECRSFYCIYDDAVRTVVFRSLPFDLEGYAVQMHGQGLDEVPWMRARRAAQPSGAVRAHAHFGRPAPRTPTRRPRAVAPRVAPASPRHPAPAPTVAHTSPPPAGRAAGRPAALVLAAVIVAGGGIWCTRALVNALPPPSVDDVKIATVSVPPPAETPPDGAATRQLADGWTALLSDPNVQTVRIVSGTPDAPTAIRLGCTRASTIRLSRTLDLFEHPPRLYWSVRLLTPAPPRTSLDFQFLACIRFFGADGAPVGETFAAGKRSAIGRTVAVPDGAARATMDIDCTCAGTFDLALPYFKNMPERRDESRPRRRRRENP